MDGVIIGPQHPGVEFHTMCPPSRPEQAVGERVDEHGRARLRRRGGLILDGHVCS
jgi:hypothetical protein